MEPSILIIAYLVLFTCLLVLQIFINKKSNTWIGLIIPAFYFAITIALSFIVLGDFPPPLFESIAMYFYLFLIFNIPNVVFIGIFVYFRQKKKLNKELERMRAHDLD